MASLFIDGGGEGKILDDRKEVAEGVEGRKTFIFCIGRS